MSRITSTTICMNCLPESSKHLLEYPGIKDDWEINGDTLTCPNCSFERPYIKRPPKIDKDGYSKGQREMMAYIKDSLIALTVGENYANNYEFKEFEVIETDCGYGRIMLDTIIGRKTDEGTAAAIFARHKRALYIGLRGGLSLVCPAKYTKDKDGKTQKTHMDGCVKGKLALTHPSY